MEIITMSTMFHNFLTKALELPKDERAELAHELILSLDEEKESDVQHAWDMEIERRISAIKAGKASGRPAEQVLAEIRARYQ